MAKKDAAAKPTGPLHPPYFEMICEAIATLKDRRGSSQPAIAKFIQDKYEKVLPPNFKKVLSVQLKKFVKSERLFKVKNSYKISSAEKLKLAVKVTQKKKEEEEEESSGDDGGGGKKKVMVMKKPKEKVAKNIAKKGVRTKSLSQVKTPDAVEKRKVIEKKLKELSPVKNPDALKKKKKKKSKAAAASSNSKPNKKKPMK